MCIYNEAKTEMARLQKQIADDTRKLMALQAILKEYNVEFNVSTQKLYDLIIGCLTANKGHSAFGEIVDYLTHQGIDIPKSKISVMLTKHEHIKYNRESGQWELIIPPKEKNIKIAV